MTDENPRTQPGEPLGHGCFVQVTAADGEIQIDQDLGDTAHADATDGHQMDMPGIPEHTAEHIVGHESDPLCGFQARLRVGSCPANCNRSTAMTAAA